MRRCAVALVHHPVIDGHGATVTTAVTNLDVHDLARSAKTYGCSDYFVVHPILAQRELVARIRDHWIDGSGARRIPDRREALKLLRVVATLDDAIAMLGGRAAVEVWVTAARDVGESVTFRAARERLAPRRAAPEWRRGGETAGQHGEPSDEGSDAAHADDARLSAGKPVLIVFGTGWGLAPSVIEAADAILEPIRGERVAYNHLSVRSACAIALDRLLGHR